MHRLQETVTSLLPPTHSFAPSDDALLGLDRVQLLRSVLPVLASSKPLQRMAESTLRAIKDREQRQAEASRDSSAANGSGVLATHLAQLPSLFPQMPVNGEEKVNGTHALDSVGSAPAPRASSPSPALQVNGPYPSKAAQLEQRIAGGGAGTGSVSHSAASNGSHAPALTDALRTYSL